jgi:hypothetical protein
MENILPGAEPRHLGAPADQRAAAGLDDAEAIPPDVPREINERRSRTENPGLLHDLRSL